VKATIKYVLELPNLEKQFEYTMFIGEYQHIYYVLPDVFVPKFEVDTKCKFHITNRVIGDVNHLSLSSNFITKNDLIFTDFIKPIFDDYSISQKIEVNYDFYN